MPNHFHILVRLKNTDEILRKARIVKGFRRMEIRHLMFAKETFASEFVSEMFRRFFMSYSKGINKQEGRKGSLFRKNFKRKLIYDIDYLRQVVYYIHHNPEHHGMTADFRDYPWTSYDRLLLPEISMLKNQEVIKWFDDQNNFINYHLKSQLIDSEVGIE
jgi:putative transposase